MKKGKRLFALFLTFILCFHMGSMVTRAEGASVTIALSSATVSIGGSVTVTVTVSGSDVSQYDIYLTYDSSVLQYVSSSGAAQANGSGGTIRLVGGTGSTSLTFTAIANGSSYVSTSGSEVYNMNYGQIPITHAGANITVETAVPSTTEGDKTTEDDKTEEPTTEEDKRSADCSLSALQVSPGKLEPAFSASTTAYFVQLEEDATSIVVSAQTADEKASTAISGADNLKKGENTVKITVTAENGAVKIYNIRVAVGALVEAPTVTIDGKPYRFVNDATELQVPERYSAATLQYEDMDVMAYESPNKRITLVCLEDEKYERAWFVYVEKDNSFIPYQEHSSKFNRYVVLPVPKDVAVPSGYDEGELMIQGKKLSAYHSAEVEDADIWLIYAINIDGDEGFYFYDAAEEAFMRYVDVQVEQVQISTEQTATPVNADKIDTKEDADTSKILLYALYGVSGLAVLLLILLIVFVVKRQTLAAELEQAESMIAHMADGEDKKVSEEEPEPEQKPEQPPVWDGYIDIIKVPDGDFNTKSDISEQKPKNG